MKSSESESLSHSRKNSPSRHPGTQVFIASELDPVAAEDVAFALSFFVLAAKGYADPAREPKVSSSRVDHGEMRIAFLLREVCGESTRSRAVSHRLATATLAMTFRRLWAHYDGYAAQASLCARVLNFYHLALQDGGGHLQRWMTPSPEQPEIVDLHPVVVEALALVPLMENGRFVPEHFLALVDALAQKGGRFSVS